MKLKLFISFIFSLLLCISFFSLDRSDDFSFVYDYVNIEESDDIYKEIIKKKIDIRYLKNLIWNKNINFYIDEFDKFNFRRNINTLPFFSHIFIPYGGFSTNRYFDIGFFYGADNVNKTGLKLNFATSFGQTNYLRQHVNIVFPFKITSDRMKLLTTISFFTSTPQYNSLINLNKEGNVFNKIWKLINIDFTDISETGFYFLQGIDYRVPLIEVNSISNMGLIFKYTNLWISGFSDESPIEESINQSNLLFFFNEKIVWSRIKQTNTVPVGNELSLDMKFYIPSSIGEIGKIFRFTSKLEEKFYYKFYKEFFLKVRGIVSLNYNSSSDYSGDPYIRGLKKNENTGFFNFITNFEIYFPAIDVYMKEAVAVEFKTKAKFVLYLNLFVDISLGIENFSYFLENNLIRDSYIASNYLYYKINEQNYFIPNITTGGGLRIYTYFLPFIIRLDVGVNILKAIIKHEATLEVVVSFSDMF